MSDQNQAPEHSNDGTGGTQPAAPQEAPAPSYEISEVIPGSQETVEKGFSLPDAQAPDEATLTEVNLKMQRVFKEIEGLKLKYEKAAPGKDKASASTMLQAKRDEWERLRRKTLTFGPKVWQP